MRCLACKHGQLKPGHTTVTVERHDTTILLRGVPADVCDTCGEDYLEADIAQAIDDTLRQAERDGVRFEVRQYQAVA